MFIPTALILAHVPFDIIIDSQSWDVMANCTLAEYKSCPRPDKCDYHDALCNYNSTERVACEVRRKGSGTWRELNDKPSFKIKKMKHDAPFGVYACGVEVTCNTLPNGALSDMTVNRWETDKVTLNNMAVGDGDVDGYKLFRDAGIIAPLSQLVTVSVYRGDTLMYTEPYAMIETISDKNFMTKHIDKDKEYGLWESDGFDGIEYKRSGGTFKDTYEKGNVDCDSCITDKTAACNPGAATLTDTNLDMAMARRFYIAERLSNHYDGFCLKGGIPFNTYFAGTIFNGTVVYVPIVHGVDGAFKCLAMPDRSKNAPRCAVMKRCFATETCKAAFDTEYQTIKANAHRVYHRCMDWYGYAGIVGGCGLGAAALSFGF